MTYQVNKYCSRCYTTVTTRFIHAKDNPDLWWCQSCYMKFYNIEHREQKNRKARLRARLLKTGTRVKKQKKPTKAQAMAVRRHLRMQLRRAEAELYLLQYLNQPPLQSNEIWRPNPGVC